MEDVNYSFLKSVETEDVLEQVTFEHISGHWAEIWKEDD